MHRKPLRQQRPLPVPQMLQPSPSRTPRALPLPTPRPKLEDSSCLISIGQLYHISSPNTTTKRTQLTHRPPSPTPARTPHNPPALGNHRRESPAARSSTIRRERAFTVTIGADFHRRCAGTPPRHGKGGVMITRQGRRHPLSPPSRRGHPPRAPHVRSRASSRSRAAGHSEAKSKERSIANGAIPSRHMRRQTPSRVQPTALDVGARPHIAGASVLSVSRRMPHTSKA